MESADQPKSGCDHNLHAREMGNLDVELSVSIPPLPEGNNASGAGLKADKLCYNLFNVLLGSHYYV